MSILDTNDIKIYQDVYANAESALVGFKGKRVDKPGVFYCPYVKPDGLNVKPKLSLFEGFGLAILFWVLLSATVYGIAKSPLTYNCFENKCETVQYLE